LGKWGGVIRRQNAAAAAAAESRTKDAET